MPKVSDAHREGRRDQILDAAMERFTAQGLQVTTMADIIAASGLSAGAIYGYFDSKQELAIAVARRAIEGRVADVLAASDAHPLSPSELLRTLSEGFDRDGVSPGLIVQLWGVGASDPAFQQIARAAFDQLSAMFIAKIADWAVATRGMTHDEAQRWAAQILPALLAFGQGLILQSAIMPDFDRERYLAAVRLVLG